MKKFLKLFLVYFLAIFYLECVYKAAVFNIWLDVGFLYTGLFSVIYALLLTSLTSLIPEKVSRHLMFIVFIIITIIFIGEAMFTFIFGSTFSIYSVNLANQAFDFRKILYTALLEHWYVILLFLVPVVLFGIFKKKFIFHDNLKKTIGYFIITILVYLITLLVLRFNKKDTYSAYSLYFESHAPTIMVTKLGLLTEFRLDIFRYLTNFESKISVDYENSGELRPSAIPEKKIEYNKLDIDFEAVPGNISDYLKNKPATNKNDYTGIFEGKNLIYILAEGFNSIAVHEDITPTLYKLVNTGLVFKNYYAPVFLSTTGGEFQFSTGLIPTQRNLTDWKRGTATFPYAVGNVFNNLGYKTYAFHDWTYTYYARQKTMPTLGYSTYVGCSNGMEKRMNCKIWPPSDEEMIRGTVDDYINDEKFAVHYITVSGHAEYNFFGNNMAARNKKAVAGLPYSDAIKAYLATQIELDKALKLLLEKLEEANRLDDTVIVLSGDHYPYSLSVNQINEISDYERDGTFEINRSNLILYNTSLENTEIEKLACSIDILPTLLNMFGYKYDSRLFLGNDIMSEHDSLVVFNDNSWISDLGRYNAKTGKFIPNESVEVEDGYVARMNREVQNRISISNSIVNTNYYKKILDTLSKEEETP